MARLVYLGAIARQYVDRATGERKEFATHVVYDPDRPADPPFALPLSAVPKFPLARYLYEVEWLVHGFDVVVDTAVPLGPVPVPDSLEDRSARLSAVQ